MKSVALVDVPRRLMATFGRPVSYDRLYRAVVSGGVPAHRDEISGRWFIDENDLPAVAQTFGLTAAGTGSDNTTTRPAA